jgi:hypothetical protein
MTRPISPRVHRFIDFATVLLLLAAGPLFQFDGKPAEITSMLAGSVLVYSVFTWFVRMISLKMHLLIDSAVAVVMIVAPWRFGFAGVPGARYFFFAFGIFSLVVAILTDASTERKASPS